MNLSHKADYALRAVCNLSKLPKGKRSSIRLISQEASIPREFLAKVLKDLAASGILVSAKGVQGGFCLKRPAHKISYLDVIEAMNGPLHLSLCTESGECSCYSVDDHCYMHQFWVAQEKVFRNALSKRHFGIKR